MDSSFIAYLQRMEMMVFFSGYPVLYAGVVSFFLAGKRGKHNAGSRWVTLLTPTYALLGTLFLGLLLKNLYPDYALANLDRTIQLPGLTLWGLSAIFFWVPALWKKPVFSLLHSLLFFFFLARDIFGQLSGIPGAGERVSNDMKIYTISLLLNLTAFVCIALFYLLLTRYKSRLKS